MSIDPLQQARQHFMDGLSRFSAGRLEDAHAAFESALALVPDRPSVLANLGAVKVRLGRFAEALPLLERAVAAEPGDAQAWGFLGVARAEQGLREPGLAALERSLALDAQRVEAWSRRGSLLREMGRLDEAAASFERAIALGADDPLHRFYLAAVRGQAAPAPPRQYVEGLFDAYAGEFAGHLTQGLRYQAHEVLARQLVALGRERWDDVLDLGCGTGLMGTLLRPAAGRLTGLDLSLGMLDQARAQGRYDELVHADAAAWLAAGTRRFDLIVAADVFIYVGALEAVFDGVAGALRAGGVLAFSVESLDAGKGDFQLMPSLRYAHSRAYLQRLGARHQLELRDVLEAPIREDAGAPVAGLYCCFQRH